MEINLKFVDEGYVGSITMTVATNIERLELMDSFGLNFDDKESDEEKKKAMSSMKTVIALLKASKDYYRKVDLKRDGKEYKSFDDLNCDPKMQGIMMQCATKALMSMGEDSQK